MRDESPGLASRAARSAPRALVYSPITTCSGSAGLDTVFTVAADCAVDFRGSDCGVAAIGRCLTCGNAFRMTHQARENNTRYVDQCWPAGSTTPAC